jgi:CO dehydrogenase/acetyl-CoA synthase beta subunit
MHYAKALLQVTFAWFHRKDPVYVEHSWLDCRAAEITPTGANQPIPKGKCIEPKVGQWDKVNEFVLKASGNKVERMSQYSMIIDPMTSCGCFECIAAVLPSTNGIMIVNREYTEMTPCGMKLTTHRRRRQPDAGSSTPNTTSGHEIYCR